MAKLIVSEGFAFNPSDFQGSFSDFGSGTTINELNDLWRVSFGSDGQAFVRGHDFDYDNNGTPSNENDDIISSGDITSFSFNAPSAEPGGTGPAAVRIRNLDDLSGEKVHDAIVSGTSEDAFGVLRAAFKGDDTLKGADEDDTLLGFKGDDKIIGNGGGDTLVGGKGQDRLYASGDDDTSDDAASDVFIFANGDSGKTAGSADKIFGFVNGEDYIDVSETGAHKKDVHIDHHDGNSYITIDAHDGQEKMMIVVIDNAEVHKIALAFDLVLM